MTALTKSEVRSLPPASRRLASLHEIGWVLLSPISGVETTVSAVLAVIVEAVPLRGAVLVECRDSRARLFAWLSAGDRPERLACLERRAEAAFELVTGLPPADLETRRAPLPGAAPAEDASPEPLVIPLALRGQAAFGVLQLETAAAVDREDRVFLETAANQVAIAIDRYYGRRRERLLRRQAEHSEKEARRVSENLERLVAERTARLEQTVKDLHSFAYSIAHDLRAPLRHIHGYTEFVVERADPESKRFARRIMAASVRMDHLISDLLQFSRLTLDEVAPAPVTPSPVLAQVISELDSQIREKKARVDVEPSLPAVMGDPGPLSLIFSNLLSNALKFTPAGVPPWVRVRSERRDGWVRLIFEDDGIGVAPAYQSRIFEVFQRLHTAEQYPGTGIGLAIVRRAAERMGGCCGVESAPGRGSRFWVELKKAQ
ncbi:MAG: HAMP domain-containing histidine kinase [Elusimicrobia bacterium]|nr:HAMP domain-containing histidine kinase [Elusimicrobiota bacterium]